MLNINVQINGKEAILTLKTDKKEFIERYIIADFSHTKLTTKSIYEQLKEDGMNSDFASDFYDVTDNSYVPNLLKLCCKWDK